MSRTINGKSIDQILEELQQDFPEVAIRQRDYDKIYYIGVDDFRERLNTVVGIAHYNEKYTPVEVIQAQDSYATKTNGTLEFLDDDFNIILIKESPGGSTIAFPKVPLLDADGKPVVGDNNKPVLVPGTTTTSIPNDLDSACQDAFKRICKKLNMGTRQLDKANSKTKIPYSVKITKPLKEYKEHRFGEGELDGKTYKIAIFKNNVDAFDKEYGNPSVGQTITFFGKTGTDSKGNDQIVFDKICKASSNITSANNSPKPSSTNNQENVNNTSEKTAIESEEKNDDTANCVQAEDCNSNDDTSSIVLPKSRFKTKTLLETAQSGFKYVKACRKDDKEPIVIIFLPEQISKTNEKEWNQFAEKTINNMDVSFDMKYCERNGKFYFHSFE